MDASIHSGSRNGTPADNKSQPVFCKAEDFQIHHNENKMQLDKSSSTLCYNIKQLMLTTMDLMSYGNSSLPTTSTFLKTHIAQRCKEIMYFNAVGTQATVIMHWPSLSCETVITLSIMNSNTIVIVYNYDLLQ